MATTKEDLHRLVDTLPDQDLAVVAQFLGDPYLRVLLNTPAGEDPLSFEELVGLLESELDVRAGRVHSFARADDAIRWLHDQAGRPD
jgi:hypothetical protein